MSKSEKIIQAIVGALLFVVAYWFVVRNQLVVEYFRPQVESGKLGVTSANLLTSVIEVLAAIGGVAIFVATRVLNCITRIVQSYSSSLIDGNVSPRNGCEVENDPKRLTADLSRMLIQAVVECNRSLTIQLAHRLAKKEFLEPSEESSK